ncbi:hypothetical protein TNCV_4507341 [Trichonephila clavipes]|nr:hypothetical protein TNCV_4507341 [Trichonephila clavipes]
MHSVCLAFAFSLRFAPTPSLRTSVKNSLLRRTLTLCTSSVSYLATFLCLPRFPQIVFSVVIELCSSKYDAADSANSVVTMDQPCAAVIWPKL